MFGKKGEKKQSPQEIITNQVEQLAEGKSLIYILPEYQWAGGAFIIVELNPKHAEEGQKKYFIFSDKIKDGKPAGKREQTSSQKTAKDVANLISTSSGKLFG
ncbi:MAG: hypothetical protein PHN78_01620 [Dehalococcoidales bacterium]|nr:hypothetical protein [Dehalococcoidales bacterium]